MKLPRTEPRLTSENAKFAFSPLTLGVLAALGGGVPLSANDCAEKLGVSRQACHKALGRLERSGFVCRSTSVAHLAYELARNRIELETTVLARPGAAKVNLCIECGPAYSPSSQH